MSASSFTKLPDTGDVIDGKYTLEHLLGRGGMGAVYAARHIKLGHAVAIKVMLADAANHEAAQRFVNEGRAAANIQNDHVVRVSDVDEENGYAYMVLELLEGDDLGQVLEREQRLPSHVAVDYVLQALRGVRQAHAQGIVHRDLKPSNLFLARRQDGSVVVKVLDFGISKANHRSGLGAAPGALTSTKALLGSPLYMSPEQLRSSKNVDARADIWAMGVILFELISGTLPFTGENLGELFAAILETDAPNLQHRQPDVPPGLAAIVARCLERRPENRFATVDELARELMPYAATSAPGPWPAASRMASTASAPPMPAAGAASSMRHDPPAQTGSAPHSARNVNGTVPLGASTPQPYGPPPGFVSGVPGAPPLPPAPSSPGLHAHAHAHAAPQQRSTGNTWQSGQSAPGTKSSSTGLVVGLVCAALAVGGITLGAMAKLRGKGDAAVGAVSVPSPSSTSPLPPPALSVPGEPSAPLASAASSSAAPSSATVPVATVGAVASAAPPVPPVRVAGAAGAGTPTRHGPAATPAATPATKPEAPKPPEPAKPVPAPRPTATGMLQDNR